MPALIFVSNYMYTHDSYKILYTIITLFLAILYTHYLCIHHIPHSYYTLYHRQWAVRKFGLWSGELAYTEQLLDEDIRNNSAWNHVSVVYILLYTYISSYMCTLYVHQLTGFYHIYIHMPYIYISICIHHCIYTHCINIILTGSCTYYKWS